MLDGVQLQWFDSVVHLGHCISYNLDQIDDLNRCRSSFISSVNSFICYFKAIQNKHVLLKLFTTYCCSFYGSVILNAEDRRISLLSVEYRKALRRILNIPHHSHIAI